MISLPWRTEGIGPIMEGSYSQGRGSTFQDSPYTDTPGQERELGGRQAVIMILLGVESPSSLQKWYNKV